MILYSYITLVTVIILLVTIYIFLDEVWFRWRNYCKNKVEHFELLFANYGYQTSALASYYKKHSQKWAKYGVLSKKEIKQIKLNVMLSFYELDS